MENAPLRTEEMPTETRKEVSLINTGKKIDYSKWGYIFIAPFFICFFIFSLIPLVDTIRYSFFQYYTTGLKEVGPNFTGISNYVELFASDLGKYTWNTFIMWIIGFVPQIIIALILAAWFTDCRLKIHGKGFFKVVIYLPNLIMASAFSMLFFTLFSEVGPINSMMMQLGIFEKPFKFLASVGGSRSLVAIMNFLMWFGNTTIMLMAAIMGISPDIFEAAEIDGCNNTQRFFKITLPLIKPILAYSLITSLIGGLQMFDVPQILTGGKGTPDRTTMTLIMFLNQHLKARNYGMAGALSVYLFIVSGILCAIVYRMMNNESDYGEKKTKKKGEKS
ncbi:multiple sugar transport system permease protein [Lachnospiraceae bacterium KH1T2]|nr:multiple sugar transport system permease protein [Lachnospiraceae bacterium KH1T2]